MINNVKIKNYKCIDECDLDFGKLTIFTGTNSSGKSSVMQGILVSLAHCGLSSKKSDMYYFSNLEKFAIFDNVRNKYLNSDIFEITINNNIFKKHRNGDIQIYPSDIKIEENFYYISADRVGIKIRGDYTKDIKFGLFGEYIPSYYQDNKSKEIYIYGNNESKVLSYNLSFWIQKILDLNFSLITDTTDNINILSKFKQEELSYEFAPDYVSTGLKFITEILIIGLSLKKGDIFAIENPEIHLHPKAVSNLAEFFAFLVNNGIQVILETHSDTLINKIRYLVHKKQLNNTDLAIYYKGSIKEKFQRVYINKKACFSNKKGENMPFPNGFMDVDLAELMDIR